MFSDVYLPDCGVCFEDSLWHESGFNNSDFCCLLQLVY